MSPKFEVPAFEVLVAEQEAVQAGKFQGRLLEEYGRHVFPGQDWREPRSCAVTDFLRPVCIDEKVSLDGVVRGLCEAKGDEPVRWVDMAGGRGLPMRRLAIDAERRARLVMTNVDLCDFGMEGLEPNEITYLEDLAPGMTSEAAAPDFIRANIEEVALPEPADLITSIEAMQYLNNPLAAISNWYNQLADNGLLVISTEHNWVSWIRYQREPGQGDYNETPAKQLLEALRAGGVAFAASASAESDWASGFRPDLDPDYVRNLVIQKRPGTRLVVNSSVAKVWVSPYDFKAAYYDEPVAGSRPLIEVI